jgi:hypothetical protein
MTLRERTTLVEWNDERAAYRSFKETVKGNHTERFQGLLDEVFECETISLTVGPAVPDDDASTTIPASASEANEQTDALDAWINPSTGPGSGWPRTEERPDVSETVFAKSVVETTKVSPELGEASGSGLEAGAIEAERFVTGWRSKTVAASHVVDRIYARGGAEIIEAVGGAPGLADGEVEDWGAGELAGTRLDVKLFVGRYGTTVYDEKTEETFGPNNFRADLVALDLSFRFGVRLTYTDLGRVEMLPGLVRESYYDKDAWVSGSSAADVANDVGLGILNAASILSFGRSETLLSLATPSVAFMVGARASIHLCPMATEIFVDHADAHPVGTHTEIGLFKATLALLKSSMHAVKSRAGAFQFEARGLNVRS